MSQLIIHVIGLGVKVPVELSHSTIEVMKRAKAIIGWERHRAIADPLMSNSKFQCVTKLTQLKSAISEYSVESSVKVTELCILASGDPLYYGIGKWVQNNLSNDAEISYQIVGNLESDPANGKISIDTPIAKSLIGKSEGDEVAVDTPSGKISLEIVLVKHN